MLNYIRKNQVIFTIILIDVICYSVFNLFVSDYYSSGLPYYDSVGSYWNMYNIINITQKNGIISGIESATRYPLSWIQSFFAVILSPVITKNPASLNILNFIMLFVFQMSIFHALKSAGYSDKEVLLISITPFIPGSLINWQGGIIDMRRDYSMFCLLGTSFFIYWDYLWRPKMMKGIILGFILGLTQWSRGNALPYIIAVCFAVIIPYSLKRKNKPLSKNNINFILIPLFSFILISLPYFVINTHVIYYKYVFGSWAVGQGLINSLIYFPKALIMLLFGSNIKVIVISFFTYLLFAIIFIFLLKSKIIKISANNGNERSNDIFISGIALIIMIFIINILILQITDLGGIFPFFPAIVGVTGVTGYLIKNIRLNKKFNKNIGNYSLFIVLTALIIADILRIYYGMPEKNQILQNKTVKIANDLKDILGNKSVTYLWLDHINLHDLNFYITGQGGKPISGESVLMHGVDTEMPPDAGKSISQQQDEFARGIRTREYILLSSDISQYNNPNAFFFLFRYGQPVISDLLDDQKYEVIYRYKLDNIPFVILKKRLNTV